MAISGVDSSQHAQRMHDMRELEALRDKDQMAAGMLGGQNTVSYYDGGLQVSSGGQTMPIAAAQPGATEMLGQMDTNELMALLEGLKTDSEDTMNKVSEEATLANRDKMKTARDQRIQQLTDQLDPSKSDKDDKCATAKIVIGSLLLPAGAVLIADGALDKKAISATREAHGQMMHSHFGQGMEQIESFQKDYKEDAIVERITGQPMDKIKHVNQLHAMEKSGVISPELRMNLERMVLDGAGPDAIGDRLLADAVAAYVDGQMPPMYKVDNLNQQIQEMRVSDKEIAGSVESVESDLAQAKAMKEADGDDFQTFLAKLAAMMEEQDEIMRQVQEDLTSGVSTAIQGQQNSQSMMGQRQNPI
ncbi:hypothetical protein [Parendozoicomonas haliclonae]|uniref:Uncharacterized protein n=1 Tax=Parendozoicomonas haliclonae TaxID=1960125 RepID=A0A1X7AMP6_9GAMM|nr:hypothetical protein [Parendozoicomonas haliclonae]SMA49350.1 hypothetical protein EHSB41UT_03198 [Parendozoicomonas haliclonae]